MLSDLVTKIKESAVSVIPILIIVTLMHYLLSPLPEGQLSRFIIAGLIIVVGLSIFLVGADLGMVPFGQRIGAVLTHRRSITLILVSVFIIGFAITIAEPDVQVLAKQVTDIDSSINRTLLLTMIAVGVGLFLIVAMLRVVMQLSLPILLVVFYLLLFGLCSLVDTGFVGIAFDSGGATTGPITVPFIIAMGIGVASSVKRSKDKPAGDNNFGFVGLASIGPIAAVVSIGFFSNVVIKPDNSQAVVENATGILDTFVREIPHVAVDISIALLPLVVIFFISQYVFLHLPSVQIRRMLTGFFYTFIGLVLFMVGVAGGFTPVGRSLGIGLGVLANGWALIPVGLILGAVVVCAEPAVWVLSTQVEDVSGGHIKRRVLLAAMSISISLAVALGMLRVVTSISIWWMLIPGYAVALILTRFTPPLFTAIAFDSGGVASGPMSTTFVLSLAVGASISSGGNPITDAFGMVAMIAMAPLITIQLLGMVIGRMEKRHQEARKTRIMVREIHKNGLITHKDRKKG
ncbi:MAG: DUF1538 domain-containing protein [Planctomycetota bacterium]|nr:DUF1538 domain-containing protein [Planctomycetota bacterium]